MQIIFMTYDLMVAMKGVILISTYPDEESAVTAARGAVEGMLAACVNITKVRSIYRWQGKVEDTYEYIVLFKTTDVAVDRLRGFIASTHKYTVPEIVTIDMDSVSKSYMEWIVESVIHSSGRSG
jgi:periplasmic divalent cation tolerance protein